MAPEEYTEDRHETVETPVYADGKVIGEPELFDLPVDVEAATAFFGYAREAAAEGRTTVTVEDIDAYTAAHGDDQLLHTAESGTASSVEDAAASGDFYAQWAEAFPDLFDPVIQDGDGVRSRTIAPGAGNTAQRLLWLGAHEEYSVPRSWHEKHRRPTYAGDTVQFTRTDDDAVQSLGEMDEFEPGTVKYADRRIPGSAEDPAGETVTTVMEVFEEDEDLDPAALALADSAAMAYDDRSGDIYLDNRVEVLTDTVADRIPTRAARAESMVAELSEERKIVSATTTVLDQDGEPYLQKDTTVLRLTTPLFDTYMQADEDAEAYLSPVLDAQRQFFERTQRRSEGMMAGGEAWTETLGRTWNPVLANVAAANAYLDRVTG